MQCLLEAWWTWHRETPQGPRVEMTPGRALCLTLSIAYRKPPGCSGCYEKGDRVTCVVSKTYEAWSTPRKYLKAVLVPEPGDLWG